METGCEVTVRHSAVSSGCWDPALSLSLSFWQIYQIAGNNSIALITTQTGQNHRQKCPQEHLSFYLFAEPEQTIFPDKLEITLFSVCRQSFLSPGLSPDPVKHFNKKGKK